ncbi:hypothetical protein [Parasphingorhabdus sp.]|jgi:hypothetical protein|uniref:hypothetical protein n=1 Tax=Parasphingorhabdus sp. TaxID=2709688 RepID=UPI0039E23857|tara:strand:- start:2533 stop:4356 length:1824 start_codon:yes stop_codon:yes gene_type:complete
MIIRELPFSKINKDVHRRASIAMAEHAAEHFPAHINSIQNLFRSAFPPHLMATIACWGMSSPVGPDGTSGKGLLEGIEQHHIELLQALLLTIDRREWGTEPATPSDVQKAIDTVKAVSAAFHKQRLQQLSGTHDPDTLLVIGLQEKMRDHTQMVRNWGYYDDMLRIVRSWHEPLDRALEVHHGFSASDLISTIEKMVSLHQKRLGDRFILLKDIFKGRTKKKIVHDFFVRYEGVAGDPAELLDSLPKRMSLRSLRMMLQVHADRWLMMEMLIDPSIIAAQTGQPVAKVVSILRSLSMVPGCLEDSDTQHLFLANPVWQKPGLHDGDDFLFFIPQSIPAFLPVILRDLSEKAGIVDDLDRRKSTYLEDEISKVVRTALPSACVKSGVKWQWQGVQYDTDLLATFDRILLIAEAKSGSVSSSALRGSPKALKQHVKRLIVEPAEQSARLTGILKLATEGNSDALAVAAGLGFDPHNIDAVVRISVTLDDFSTMAMSEFELKRAGWIPQDLKLPPTLNLAELGSCVDILSDPLDFLNYFAARERLQGATPIFGYEMDYLGMYLENGLDLPELLAGTHSGMIAGMSFAIDRYFLSRDTGSPVAKPRILGKQ